LLRIDAVIRNVRLTQIQTRLEQAGIQNYSISEMNSNSKLTGLSFYAPRSTLQIICKNSQKDLVIEAISSGDDGGLIYVNHLTPIITLNQKN
jgi:nitrogen regulatory protein PII